SPKHRRRTSSNTPAEESATRATKDATAWPPHGRRHRKGNSARTTRNATPRSPRSAHPSNGSWHTSNHGGSSTPTTHAHMTPTATRSTPPADYSSSPSHGVLNNLHCSPSCRSASRQYRVYAEG